MTTPERIAAAMIESDNVYPAGFDLSPQDKAVIDAAKLRQLEPAECSYCQRYGSGACYACGANTNHDCCHSSAADVQTMNTLTTELVCPSEDFPRIAKACRKFASQCSEVLDSLMDADTSHNADQKWSIIDDMLCDLHDACDTIDP